jgi:UDP-N-acetylmuramoyl-L-alanyl-D-glutamate--2,6-diaminopimelate ligase
MAVVSPQTSSGRVFPLQSVARWIGAQLPRLGKGVDVQALCTDSREATPGCVFFAIPGHLEDGTQYVAQAVAAGAVAVVAEEPLSGTDWLGEASWLQVENVRRAKALAAHAFYGNPSRMLTCVGVTGTNGKTTTCTMLHAILEAEGWRPGLVSTIEERLPDGTARGSRNTTPDAIHLARTLAEIVRQGGRGAVVEVSSHALSQERTAGLGFRAGVFTQLSREHLDYHGSVEDYVNAKGRLFRDLESSAVCVLNAEDPCSLRWMGETRARAFTYGLTPGVDVTARLRRMDIDGLAFDLCYRGLTIDLHTRLIGRHNLMNALAAASTALALEVSPRSIQQGFEMLQRVPGRLEPVDRGQDFRVLVDYAHTDDALEKVLRLLRPLTRGRLLTVFGCGGDRDRHKRPQMGKVAADLADEVFLTSDNPRSEDPADIALQVRRGMSGQAKVVEILDRREAIHAALSRAQGGDIVLIAGKGHESVQIVGAERLPFDDRTAAEEILWQLSP